MTYATLMVHLELGQQNAGLLKIASGLAERFDAGVIGIAACQPMPMVCGDGQMASDALEFDRTELAAEMKAAEAEFLAAFQACARPLEWRSSVDVAPLCDYLAREARAADLVITSAGSGKLFDASRAIDCGDLVMKAGRPVLIVPAAADSLALDRVLVAWKDTRETRRAARDALPLLKQAAHVAVVETASGHELAEAGVHVADVVAWLHWHGIVAEPLALPAGADDAAGLYTTAEEQGADVIVAGAYGHSRLREWVLGGVTRDLLLSPSRCSLVSH